MTPLHTMGASSTLVSAAGKNMVLGGLWNQKVGIKVVSAGALVKTEGPGMKNTILAIYENDFSSEPTMPFWTCHVKGREIRKKETSPPLGINLLLIQTPYYCKRV